MNSITQILSIIIIFVGIIAGQNADTELVSLDGFRNAKFGMNKNEVMRVEKAKAVNISPEDYELYFLGEYAGQTCYFGYFFDNDSLVRGMLDFSKIYLDKNVYIERFNEVVRELEKAYGEPTILKELWKNLTQRDHREMWGYAIGKHQMQLVGLWQFKNGTIEIRLYGFNGSLSLEVNFYSHRIKFDAESYW